jgi:hypothetical protein
MQSLKFAWQLIINPVAAFESLKQKPNFFFPLLTISVSSALVFFWFYSVVDFDWLRDQMLLAATQGKEISAAEQKQMSGFMSKNTLMWSSVFSALLVLPIIRMIEATYYLLIGKMTRAGASVETTFKQWFSMACWAGFPSILAVVLMALAILVRRDGQLSPDALSLLSLNELFFHTPATSKWHSLLTSLTILNPYIWWLSIVGVHVFSKRSMVYAAVVVMTPLVLIYGGWIAVVSFR